MTKAWSAVMANLGQKERGFLLKVVSEEMIQGQTLDTYVETQADAFFAFKTQQNEVTMAQDGEYAMLLGRHDYGHLSSNAFERNVEELKRKKPAELAAVEEFTCGVCFEEIPKTKDRSHQLSCRHRFCINCVRNILISKITSGERPRCMEPNCNVLYDLQRCSYLLAGCGEVFLKAQKLILEQ